MAARWQDFQGVNQGYVEELYERFVKDPKSVDDETRELFAKLGPPPSVSNAPIGKSPLLNPTVINPEIPVGAFNLAQSIRRYGHLAATIDPLGGRPTGDPALEAETHHVTTADLEALPGSLSGAMSAGRRRR